MVDKSDNKTGNQQKNIQEDDEYMREQTSLEFLTWLNSDCHMFHISGKAGAGKLTLM